MSEETRIDNLREELGGESTEEVEETAETTETDVEDTSEEDTEDTEDTETGEETTTDKKEEEVLDGDDIPEKFRGKTAREIIKSYTELETLIGQRALGKGERQDLKDAGMGRKDLGSMEEMAKVISETDFSKMDAKQFAEWLVGVTDKRATERAREIYQTASTVQQAVRTEIGEATEKFPLLKSNKEFRELTLAVIEADASRGTVTPIIEAAQKVSAMIGAQKQEETQKKNEKDRKRTAVETTQGGNGDKKETEEERVVNGLLRGKQSSAMGGLGI